MDVDLRFSENVGRKEVKFVFSWNQTCQWECWQCWEWKANAGEFPPLSAWISTFLLILPDAWQSALESWSTAVLIPNWESACILGVEQLKIKWQEYKTSLLASQCGKLIYSCNFFKICPLPYIFTKSSPNFPHLRSSGNSSNLLR